MTKILDAERVLLPAMVGKKSITVKELLDYSNRVEERFKRRFGKEIYFDLSSGSIYNATQLSSAPMIFDGKTISNIHLNEQILLRVWDKVDNTYWSESMIRENAKWLLFPDNQNIQNITIERCTYAPSKSGELIYENDVVRASNGNLSTVVFKNWRFVLESESDPEGEFWGTKDLEIIGPFHTENEK